VQVTLHQQPGLPGQGQPDHSLEIGIHREGNRGFLLAANRVGKLLNPDDHGDIHITGGDRHKTHLEGRPARSAGSFAGEGFDPFHTGVVDQQGTQVGLVRGNRGQEIAHIQRLRQHTTGIRACRFDGLVSQAA
jgi:hypothetical protein